MLRRGRPHDLETGQGRPERAVRGRTTWLLYAEFGCFGYLLNGLGGVLAPLQRDLHVSRTAVAFYPSLFAAGLLAVGVAGGALVERAGRRAVRTTAVALLTTGGGLLAVPVRPVTLLGAALLGAGGALLVQLVPALLTALHPAQASVVVAEANAAASATSVLAPLAVGAAIGASVNWRWGYLTLPVAGFAVVTWLSRAAATPKALPAATAERAAAPGAEPGPLPGRWFDVLLAVSAEFCLVFWSASWMTDQYGAGPGLAPTLAALFLVGMATARATAGPVTRRIGHPQAVLAAGSAVGLAGFILLWAAPETATASAGLLITGLGVALLYPTTVSRVVAAWPHAPDRAAARAALASGLAIGCAPALLAGLADLTSLRIAFLVVPLLLLALGARATLALATVRRRPRSPRDERSVYDTCGLDR
jgi:MFS family permease